MGNSVAGLKDSDWDLKSFVRDFECRVGSRPVDMLGGTDGCDGRV
jgi:hypothetical protein